MLDYDYLEASDTVQYYFLLLRFAVFFFTTFLTAFLRLTVFFAFEAVFLFFAGIVFSL